MDRGKPRPVDAEHPYYEPPPDHLTNFSYRSIVALAQPPFRVQRVEGISLLWGFPPWGRLLSRAPRPVRHALLRLAHTLARLWPRWADVVVLVAERSPTPAER
jgi:hypothetical protein